MNTPELIAVAANVFGAVLGGALGGVATAVVTVVLRRRQTFRSGRSGVVVRSSLGVGVVVGAVTLAWLSGLVWIAGVGVAVTVSAVVVAWLRDRRRPLLASGVLARAGRFAREASRSETDYVFDNDPGVWLERVYTVQQVRPAVDEPERRTEERRLSSVQLLSGAGHVVLRGEAGVGKSSLLQQVARRSWDWWPTATRGDGARAAPFPGMVPIRVLATDLVGKSSVAEAFDDELAACLGEPPAPGAVWLILVDAVDEITDADARLRVWRLLGEAMRGSRFHRYIVTTRGLNPATSRNLESVGATEYRLEPFTVVQLKSYLVAYQMGAGTDSDRAEGIADRFITDLADRHVLDIVRLPLLARLAADQYLRTESLPDRAADIYDRAVAGFLAEFDRRLNRNPADVRRGVERLLGHDPMETVRELLPALAVRHLAGEGPLVGTARVELAVEGVDDRSIEALLEATGLIVDAHTQPRFVHRTFAEYLAAPVSAQRYGDDPAVWAQALAEAGTRSGALFAAHRLSPENRRRLVRALADEPDWVVQAGRLAADGLCTEDDRDCVIDRLWQQVPGAMEDDFYRWFDWWGPIRALLAVPRNREHLERMATDRSVTPADRVRAADLLARHTPTRVDLLHELVTAFSDDEARLTAIDALAEHDVVAGVAELEAFLDGDADDLNRIFAMVKLAKYRPADGIALLRRHARSLRLKRFYRVCAADYLVGFDEAAGIRLLRRLARGRPLDNLGWIMNPRRDLTGELRLLAAWSVQRGSDHRGRVSAAIHLGHRRSELGTRELLRHAAARRLDVSAKIDAARGLGALDPQTAQSLLSSYAADPRIDAFDRISAAEGLVEHDAARAAGFLVQLATDRQVTSFARGRAADVLSDMEHRLAIAPLEELATDDDAADYPRVRAARRLIDGGQPTERWLPVFVHDARLSRYERLDAVTVLLEGRPDAVGGLGLSVVDEIEFVAAAMSDDEATLNRLTEIVTDGSLPTSARGRAAERLSKVDADRMGAIQSILELTTSGRFVLLTALTGRVEASEIATRLRPFDPVELRVHAHWTWSVGLDLGSVRDDLESSHVNRLSLLEAGGRNPELLRKLVRRLESPDLDDLAHHTERLVKAEPRSWRRYNPEMVRRALAGISADDTLIPAWKIEMLWSMRDINHRACVEQLMALLPDAGPVDALRIHRRLALAGSPDSLDALKAAARGGTPLERAVAATGWVETGDPDGLRVLESLLGHADPHVHEQTVHTLRRQDPDNPVLESSLKGL